MGAAQSPILTYGGGVVKAALLMHLTGANNGTTFTDVYGSTPWNQSTAYASAPYTVTSTAVGSPFAGVNSSLYTATANTGILLPGADLVPAWNGFGTGDFTVEYWFYDTNTTSANGSYPVCGMNSTGFPFQMGIEINGSSPDRILICQNTSIVGVTNISANTWHSAAYCRKSGVGYLFLDGNLEATKADTTNYGPYNPSGSSNPGFYINGCQGIDPLVGFYMSEFRLTMGFARYTSSYTPATAPFQY
jgi:hypothetical protein